MLQAYGIPRLALQLIDPRDLPHAVFHIVPVLEAVQAELHIIELDLRKLHGIHMLCDHIKGEDDGGQGEGEGRRKGREEIPPLISQHEAKTHPLGRAEAKTEEIRQLPSTPLLRHCSSHGFRRMDLQNAADSCKDRSQTYHQREESGCRPALPVIMQLSFRKIIV